MAQALAIKYRPKSWEDVVEQKEIKTILESQLESNELQHCYLFVGSAGTGKTTCARIFANKINSYAGSPIELDAASNNSVDDMRILIQQAKSKSLDSEYKVFIVDECHMITVQGWNAILKLIEEPPAKSIFIFCTTDPQKIPKTILSRIQRYDFQRISQRGIVERLHYICEEEEIKMPQIPVDTEYSKALEYIAKIADGGMRDAITMLDKCLSYSKELTLQNVVKAIGSTDYDVMFDLTEKSMFFGEEAKVIEIIERLHSSGKDLKAFIRDYTVFLLDLKKYLIGCPSQYISIPMLDEYKKWMDECDEVELEGINTLLNKMYRLSAEVKYSSNVKVDLEIALIRAS